MACIAGLDCGGPLCFDDFDRLIAFSQISLNLSNLELSTRMMMRQLLTQRFGVEHFQWLDDSFAAFDVPLLVELRPLLVANDQSRRFAVVGLMLPLVWP